MRAIKFLLQGELLMTSPSENINEHLNTRGLPQHLVKHFNDNIIYFSKLLLKDYNNPDAVLTLQDRERIKEAFEKTHHIREYEISLYWSRLNYLWTITAVLFAGWGVILNSMINPENGHTVNNLQYFTLFLISMFGVALTIVSRLITKAGKHWQQVWEYNLTRLEPFQSGNLYGLKFKNGNKIAPSISRSVSIFHIFLLFMWGSSALFSATIPFFENNHAFLIVEFIVLVLMYWLYSWINQYVVKSDNNVLTLL
ncbi:hypothetical protein ACMGGS_13150 [Superficieibacter sp. BNK-5]|uniref:RipA family octameric membrane protein n=1 Tax=Superficieibacter sp. BNK-5 TaxID=3376142 RepID=UPI0039BF90E5